jgi:hypothetical protein
MVQFNKTIWRQSYNIVLLVITSKPTFFLYKSLKRARTHGTTKSSGRYDDFCNKIINLALVQFCARGRHSVECAAYWLLLVSNGLRELREIHLGPHVN